MCLNGDTQWYVSRAEDNIDINPAKQNYYTVHLFHINTCVLYVQKISN